MSQMMTGTLEYLRRPFATNLRPGQRVLILTDTRHDSRVWQAVMTMVADARAEPVLALFEPRPADYYDPPQSVARAMLDSDLNVLVTSTGMLHCPANSAAMQAGVPCICIDGGLRLEDFQSGAATVDMIEMARIKHRVADRVFGADAKACRVTSRYGTDLTYSVEGRIFVPPMPSDGFDPYKIYDFAKDENRGGGGILVYLFPTGELNIPPVEWTAEGKLVVDLTMHHLGRLHDPIELTITKGRVVAITGGSEAHRLRQYLETYGDENAYMCPAEASVGINRRAIIRGNQREDKNIFGAMHFGLGTNVDVGGTIQSNIHMDGVVLEPTLEVDGEMRMKDGEFLVPVLDG